MPTTSPPLAAEPPEDGPPSGERVVAAIFDGAAARPSEPLDLPPGTPVQILVPVQRRAHPSERARRAALAHPARAAGLLAGAIALALLAQLAVARGLGLAGVAIYLVAVAGAVYAARAPQRSAWSPGPPARTLPPDWRLWLTVAALAAGGVAFATSTGNRYRLTNVLPWLLAVVAFAAAHADYRRLRLGTARARLATPGRLATLALLVAILALGAAFRFVALAENPLDMNSDQAEKLLDVGDVLAGKTFIFFERNTGREPWQFYWTVALIHLFDLRPDFMALKLGTALIGWLMLPAIFILGREVLGTRAALLATCFAAVASWGVITARFGLRYPLAPCAVAWTLALLVRGLRRESRNSLLAAGLWAGIGLQGYTAYRFMLVAGPLILALWLAWLLLRGQRYAARRALVSALLAGLLALLTTLPLLRYGFERPDQLFYRAATRLTGAEQAIPGNPALIFLNNLENVLLMFNARADEVWVANLPDRPAMDVVLGALLVVGAAGCLALSWRTRNPWPALTLMAGVLMLIPSALSIAFPNENPSVVRAGGALPALMIVCAAGPAILLELLRAARHERPGAYRAASYAALSGVVALTLAVVAINQRRVFVDYPAQYCPRAQNASDIARELLAWEARGHPRSDAWIVGYPHWVDSRAVGVWIGEITFPNTVMGPEQVAAVDLGGRPGWFVLNREDLPSLQALYARYPLGQERLVEGSQCAGRAFVVFETQPGGS